MSIPQLSPSHHSRAGHQDKVWLPPRLSAHSPCCRDEDSSISSPATLCKEESHRLLLQAGGPCCACLLFWCSPESCAWGQDLFPRGTKGPRITPVAPWARTEGVYRQQQQVLKAQQGPASTPAPNAAGLLQEAGGRSALTWLQPSGFPTSQLPKTC